MRKYNFLSVTLRLPKRAVVMTVQQRWMEWFHGLKVKKNPLSSPENKCSSSGETVQRSVQQIKFCFITLNAPAQFKLKAPDLVNVSVFSVWTESPNAASTQTVSLPRSDMTLAVAKVQSWSFFCFTYNTVFFSLTSSFSHSLWTPHGLSPAGRTFWSVACGGCSWRSRSWSSTGWSRGGRRRSARSWPDRAGPHILEAGRDLQPRTEPTKRPVYVTNIVLSFICFIIKGPVCQI